MYGIEGREHEVAAQTTVGQLKGVRLTSPLLTCLPEAGSGQQAPVFDQSFVALKSWMVVIQEVPQAAGEPVFCECLHLFIVGFRSTVLYFPAVAPECDPAIASVLSEHTEVYWPWGLFSGRTL